jgi:ribosomal protein S18 acetylase RimI-like enzyme
MTTETQIVIRNLTIKDRESLLTLADLIEPTFEPKAFNRYISKRNITTLVAMFDDCVVGYLILEVNKDALKITHIGIHREFRRNKIGSGLVRNIVNHLNNSKRKRICIDVAETELEVQLFLRACKLRCVDVTHGSEDKDDDIYKFEYRSEWPDRVISNDKKGSYVRVK